MIVSAGYALFDDFVVVDWCNRGHQLDCFVGLRWFVDRPACLGILKIRLVTVCALIVADVFAVLVFGLVQLIHRAYHQGAAVAQILLHQLIVPAVLWRVIIWILLLLKNRMTLRIVMVLMTLMVVLWLWALMRDSRMFLELHCCIQRVAAMTAHGLSHGQG